MFPLPSPSPHRLPSPRLSPFPTPIPILSASLPQAQLRRQIQEYYCDFLAINQELFSLNVKSLVGLYGPSWDQPVFDRVTSGILAVLLSLKKRPLIRRPLPPSPPPSHCHPRHTLHIARSTHRFHSSTHPLYSFNQRLIYSAPLHSSAQPLHSSSVCPVSSLVVLSALHPFCPLGQASTVCLPFTTCFSVPCTHFICFALRRPSPFLRTLFPYAPPCTHFQLIPPPTRYPPH